MQRQQRVCAEATESLCRDNRESVLRQQRVCAETTESLCRGNRESVQRQQRVCAETTESLCRGNRESVQRQQRVCAEATGVCAETTGSLCRGNRDSEPRYWRVYSTTTGLIVGCLTSQQHASVSQGRICSDNFTCCHTEIEDADQTFYLTQSQYTDTGPTSPSTDPITPGAWQGSHWTRQQESEPR